MKSWNFTTQRILTRMISQKSLLKELYDYIVSKLSRKYQPKRSNLVLRQHIESFDDYIETFDWKKFHNTIPRFSLNGLGLSTTLFDI